MTRTVADWLAQARVMGVDRLDAQLILAHALAQSRSWVIAHDDALLDATRIDTVRTALGRRAAGEPLAYLLGEKEFHGLRLHVDANVRPPATG